MSAKFNDKIRKAKHGDAQAQFQVAEAYRAGNGVAEDFTQALYWYRAAAEQGNISAQNNLGTMLQRGIGTEKNPKMATYWYRQAAEQGEMVAQFNLAMRYARGDGVEQNDTDAAHWFARSAEQGYVEAIGELGTMYRFGRGVPKDIVAAARYHTEAAMAGDVTSIGNLLGYQSEIEDAAVKGSAVAALCLAKMYAKGVPVEKDLTKARIWLRTARRSLRSDDLIDNWDQVALMERAMTTLCPTDEPLNSDTQANASSPRDVVLDPRKFEDDILVESEEWTDDDVFENIYDFGLALESDHPDYQKWCDWLAKNHPDGKG
ncbi:tetratricopeptide repeat protein [Paraburkholderia elongata]|nr:tetratricopeptide repeat protein [Paraburkholderia elongata]